MLDNDADTPSNTSDNPHLSEVVERRKASRRDFLAGTTAAGLAGAVGLFTVTEDAAAQALGQGNGRAARRPQDLEYAFSPVPVNRLDQVSVPPGYTAKAFLPWGTPITGSYPPFVADGSNSGADQEQQVGQHHDGMHYFPIAPGMTGNRAGLLCVNHEYIQQDTLLPNGPTLAGGRRSVEDEVRKEIAAHGVSVVEIFRDERSREWKVARSRYNRRITGATPMEITGPVRGSRWVQTKYSPGGTRVRGTLNNCAHGYTPWGTYLTCEENWAGYFVSKATPLPREQARYGVPNTNGRYRWEEIPGDAYERFNATPVAGATAAQDYRNEPNGFGWVVEIDPFAPRSAPKKRTALGRFAHEGAWFAPAVPGQPMVVYMGDDSQNEYIYKFVTRERYNPAQTNGDCLDDGVLYVAKFNDDGSGAWLPLDYADAGFRAAAAARGVAFENQADVLVNTRLAADVVGATKMDRPEWIAVHPVTREVYITLTNNAARAAGATDAANPRGPNPFGHIVRWRELAQRSDARRFNWDIFVLAGPETDSAVLGASGGNVPALDATNRFASPDGLWIDQFGTLWIQTDMSGTQLNAGPFGNNAMLVADPDTGLIKRFFTGVPGCEVTGVISTPNGRTLFANLQHPGEQGALLPGSKWSSSWPDGGLARPRSAVVVVTKDDGGIVGT
jgi:secreted PhoX family phosphatase